MLAFLGLLTITAPAKSAPMTPDGGQSRRRHARRIARPELGRRSAGAVGVPNIGRLSLILDRIVFAGEAVRVTLAANRTDMNRSSFRHAVLFAAAMLLTAFFFAEWQYSSLLFTGIMGAYFIWTRGDARCSRREDGPLLGRREVKRQ